MSPAMDDAYRYVSWILKTFSPFLGPRTLEIGTGRGIYVPLLYRHCRSFVSIDSDPSAVESAAQRWPGVTFRHLDIAAPDFCRRLSRPEFDSVVFINVLEHVKDHFAALANCHAALRPGGYLLLLVPAFRFLYCRLDALAGHFRRYHRSEIVALLPSRSWDIVKADYFNALGGVGWFLSRMHRAQGLDDDLLNWQIRFFDRWIIPFSRLVQPLTRSIFGLSLVVVARARDASVKGEEPDSITTGDK